MNVVIKCPPYPTWHQLESISLQDLAAHVAQLGHAAANGIMNQEAHGRYIIELARRAQAIAKAVN